MKSLGCCRSSQAAYDPAARLAWEDEPGGVRGRPRQAPVVPPRRDSLRRPCTRNDIESTGRTNTNEAGPQTKRDVGGFCVGSVMKLER